MKKVFAIIGILISTCFLPATTCMAAETPVHTEHIAAGSTNSNISMPSQRAIQQWLVAHGQGEALAALTTGTTPAQEHAAWVEITNFVYYGQEQVDSCIPASMRMALQALIGTDITEQFTQQACGWNPGSGSNLYICRDSLNKMPYGHTFTIHRAETKDLFTTDLYSALQDGFPVVMRIQPVSDDWFYDVNPLGHVITIYGMTSDTSMVKVADPWGEYSGKTDLQQFIITTDKLFEVYNGVYLI
ncbi:hypothetical protein D2E26_0409 [Bifidobacterium dolichotidis]|uniref:Peptidase C39-like domain-containing protein n=1 Tax=Bifidobacterium dolichotidis TaxID=2306976 RepID=A0A430FSI5_9BIFI|nr:C39 family peptidase [Bifidobacterium dolichotidis]RSX55846.1 hypothetical protein D2E26_0409 [Bifidobacterium dolichotidis]